MQPSRSEEARVFRSIRRVCYAGLDSVTLRQEVAQRIAAFIPSDARTFATTDPDTGLFTHMVAENLPASLGRAWLEHLYPFEVAEEINAMARTGTAVTTTPSGMVIDLLRSEGFGQYMRTVLAERTGPRGFTCMLREGSAATFSARETAFMRRLAPHLTRGLHAAALVESGLSARDATGAAEADAAVPGVLVLDVRGRFLLRNASARTYIEDLRDVGTEPDAVPYAVAGAVAQLALRTAAAEHRPELVLGGALRAHGRSGRWYTIRASLSEPDAVGNTSTIVLIEVAKPAENAMILSRLYGLTRREREIVALAAKGESTKEIARQLAVSPYTVQEHLGNAFGKVGVRSRKALLAKLFFDGYAPRLAH